MIVFNLDVVTQLFIAGFFLLLPCYLVCLTVQIVQVTVLWLKLRAIDRPVHLPFAQQRVEMGVA